MILANSLTRVLTARGDRLALIGLFAGACAISFAPIFVRASALDPTATAFYRFLFAIPFIWLWLGLEGRRDTVTHRRPAGLKDRARLMLAGLFFAGDMACLLLLLIAPANALGRRAVRVDLLLWSEVAVASLKHPWDNKMRLPDESWGEAEGQACDL